MGKLLFGIHRSTWRIGLKLLAAIVGIELAIMVLLDVSGLETASLWLGIADALLLGLCSSVLIYLWVVRPLQQAKRQNDLYNTVVNSLPVGVVVTEYRDDEHAIVSVNPAFTRITGYAPEDVMGKHPRLLQGDDMDEVELEETRAAMWKNNPTHVVRKNYRKDGTAFWNDLYLSPILDGQGHAIQWVGLVHDVTERKKLEDRVQRLAHAVEQTEEAMCTFDPDGNIDFCNPAFCKNVGLDTDHVTGSRVWDFWSKDDPVTEQATAAVRQGDIWSGRHKRRRADGGTYEAFTSLSPVRDETGCLIRYSALHRDISEMAKMENELIHAQRMESVGTLAGGIAHDFNNVLAAIMGNLFLMKEDVEDRPRVQDRIKTIEKQGYRAAEMIRQLLTFARKGVIDKKPFDLKPFFKELVRFTQPAVPENIRLSFEVADKSMMVNGDPGQIQQCILNLITNARHAIEEKFGSVEDGEGEGGHIRLTVRCGEPPKNCNGECLNDSGQPQSRQCVEIRVADNGCGMSDTVCARIFEPYYTTKGVGKGTGLGLPMVFGCVQMHQGCMLVESTPGEGSVFSLYLPQLGQQKCATPEADDEVIVQGNGECILIADDNEPMRETLRDILIDAGYHVVTAEDGEDAIDVFHENEQEIRLAFLDLVMPHHDGKVVARHIKAARPDAEIALMTGYDFSDTISSDSLILNGSIQMIRKPWAVKDINRALGAIRASDATPVGRDLDKAEG
ncbi:MAG: hypothetical protein BMS9Abin18_1343 [Zetaproteobacteria bacterium]|nr:MAG: hypothetical protein BMS9Abin18_1343 [Zetaproteobacteria bacterium]